MPDHLIVITGAGASSACTTLGGELVHERLKPPLAAELFQAGGVPFEQILYEYPLAQAAAADIDASAGSNASAVEDFLRKQLRDSNHFHRRQQYRAVLLYLQHLLFIISRWNWHAEEGYTARPDCYDRLVSAALELNEVVFITLNYDTILDQRLSMHGDLLNMDSYIGAGENWSLIKLHGSVNWAQRVTTSWTNDHHTDLYFETTFRNLGDDLQLDDDIVLRTAADIRRLRSDGEGSSELAGKLYYPALSAPLGPGDKIVCPPNHRAFLKERLTAYEGLNLLVIGYSGLDQEVLKLLRESENSIRTLTVVSKDDAEALNAARTVWEGVLGQPMDQQPPNVRVFGDFRNFVQPHQLRPLIDALP